MDQAEIKKMILDIVTARSPRGWLIIDRNYRIVFANDAMVRMWQAHAGEAVGRSLPDFVWDGKKKDLAGHYLSPVVETMDSGREIREREISVYSQMARAHLWYLANTYIFHDAKGRPEYVAGNYVVIDRFKAIENKLNAINMHIIKAFAKAIGARDAYTMRHAENVAALMVGLADFMRFAAEETALAYLAGIVHDIGKIGVPEALLNKPGRLTADESKMIEAHATVGAEILGEIEGFAAIAAVVRHHHERWDGLGYPDKISRYDIPILSRMLAVCDAYDAMIHVRCYREPYGVEKTLAEIERGIGKQFDPMIARCFLDYVRRQGKAPLTLEPLDGNYI